MPEFATRAGIVFHHADEFFLARNDLRHVQLTADPVGAVEERHVVTTLVTGQCHRQPGGTGAHDRDLSRVVGFLDHQFGLVAGTWIEQTR